MTKTPVFKGASGAWLTKQLFYETADTSREHVLFTLKDDDHQGYPSLRRLYLELGDESEFYFAQQYLGGWPHWKRLLKCSWFMDALTEIREELAVRNAADNLIAIRKKAAEGDLKANQYLLEKKYSKEPVGRPSKERIIQEAEKLTKDSLDVSDDFDRVMNTTGLFQ